MATDARPLTSELALRGILALLAADRQRRADHSAGWILARAGLSRDQIASITRQDADHLGELIDDGAFARARPQSVIERAREALSRGGRSS